MGVGGGEWVVVALVAFDGRIWGAEKPCDVHLAPLQAGPTPRRMLSEPAKKLNQSRGETQQAKSLKASKQAIRTCAPLARSRMSQLVQNA